MANTVYPRLLKKRLLNDLGSYPAVAVMGARQVGKSTLCRQIGDTLGFAYRTLDERDTLAQAIEDPEGLLDSLPDDGAVLDEIQRAPSLLLALKALIDRDTRLGRFLLCGSNQPKVSSAIGDSLQGRVAYRTLRPFTLTEQRFNKEHVAWDITFGRNQGRIIRNLAGRAAMNGELDWRKTVKTGGFPRALAATPETRMQILNDYVETFSRRDIREVVGIESPERFESFLRLLAARTAQELNTSGLSRDLGTPVNTIRRWIDALQRSYLIEVIPPFSRNSSNKVIKAAKVTIVDSALAMAASRETDPNGFHLESLIASDLCVWRDAAPERALYHWRLAGGQEVDFIIQQAAHVIPVEVKSTNDVNRSDARHLRKFRENYSEAGFGLLISNDPDVRDLGDGITAAPWWGLL